MKNSGDNMKELTQANASIKEAFVKITNVLNTTTNQGDHTTLSTCTYQLDRALKLVEQVQDLIDRYHFFE